MFQELIEEYRPGNIQLPAVRVVDDAEWKEITDGYMGSPSGYETHRYLETSFLCVFAEARHVEFLDMTTGKLCLPPERFLIPVFKKMAKSKGPFVVTMQYGFRNPMANGHERLSVRMEGEYTRRVLDPLKIVVGSFTGPYDWKRKYAQFASRHLELARWEADLGVNSNTTTSVYALSRYPQLSGLLVGREDYIIHFGESNAENE
jgi:hypothetical protein